MPPSAPNDLANVSNPPPADTTHSSNQFFPSTAFNTSPASNMGGSYGSSSDQSWNSNSTSPASNMGGSYNQSSAQPWDANSVPANQSWNSGGSTWNESGSSWDAGGWNDSSWQ